MALSIPTRVLGGPDPAADVNAIVTETNRVAAIVDGDVATLLNGIDVAADARSLRFKDVVSPPASNPVSSVKLYSDAGTLKVRNPAGDVLSLNGLAASPTPEDQALAGWSFDSAGIQGSSQLTSGTIYLARIPIRRTVAVTKIWLGVGTIGSGFTGAQTWAGLVGPTGTVLASAGAATALGTTGAQSVTISSQTLAPGVCWVALLAVASTMPFLTRGSNTVLNANLSAAAFRFAVNGTGQTALPGSFTLASNSATNALTLWAALS